MKKFVPQQIEKKEKFFILALGMPKEMNTDLDAIAKEVGLNKQELARQMLAHCISEHKTKETL